MLSQARTQHLLQARARLYKYIRDFFDARAVTEVSTAIFVPAVANEAHIQPVPVTVSGINGYLHPSPEHAMKKLLCAGSGSIYQICSVFRDQESGQQHASEFSLLEWYRVGWDHHQLMQEVAALVQNCLGQSAVQYTTYAQIFEENFDINPHNATDAAICQLGKHHIDVTLTLERRHWLSLLMDHCLNQCSAKQLLFVYDYPVEEAAAARCLHTEQGDAVAARFELYAHGMELANGYWELSDPIVQKARFLAQQKQQVRPTAIDESLIQALHDPGLPDCAGVALGLDRLLMLQLNADCIQDVIQVRDLDSTH